jgi:hypothetical protein
VYGQKPWTSKYLRKCCVYFRTCSHTHNNCGYTTFYPKILSVWKLFKRCSYLLKLPLWSLYRQSREYMYVHRYVRTKIYI